MAEAYLSVILAGDQAVLPLAEVMLECVAHTNMDIAAITFTFWQLLAEGLAKSERKDLVAGFATSIFPRLFEHLYRVACYPDDYETWPRDLQDDFRETRKTEVAMTLRTTCSIMGTSACFAKIASVLQNQLAPSGYPATGNWRLLEGAMFCMRALGRCVDTQPGTDPMVGSILKILPQLPNNKEIHYTSLLIVGRYADWLKTDPSLLWPLFSYVVTALGHSDTAPSAAVSFKNICASCAHTIAETHLQDILQIATNSMQSPQLHISDHVEVLDGVSKVISTLPFDSGVSSLQTLCLPLLTFISQHTSKPESKSLLSDSLCKLATLFLCTQTFRNNPKHTAPIVEAIWPILEPIFAAHPTDAQVIDQLLRCIRYLLDNFPSSFEPSPTSTLLPTLFSHFKSTFRLARNPAILYTTSAFLKYNSHKADYIPPLWDVLLDFSHSVLKAQHDAVADAELVGEYCALVEYAVRDFGAQVRATAGLVDGIVGWCGMALVQIAQLSRQDRHQREAFYSICKLFTTMLQEGLSLPSPLSLSPLSLSPLSLPLSPLSPSLSPSLSSLPPLSPSSAYTYTLDRARLHLHRGGDHARSVHVSCALRHLTLARNESLRSAAQACDACPCARKRMGPRSRRRNDPPCGTTRNESEVPCCPRGRSEVSRCGTSPIPKRKFVF